ncbi:hypothetical protein B0H63DRAFT_225769 [Podospora didyma]|uniref:Uncharacterized protein n=1 Tax=Podospora didyma TaxID=330526 RepID=A0AAE0NBD1_9PEZI|nr:hypothetical protein B0H63DRAFT_225769 [Podospora didyma]
MESTWSHLVQRDDAGSGGNTLGTGAIAGIAAGAGALLLSAAGLFILYWRRQKQFDRAETAFYSNQSMSEDMTFPTGMPKVYTMDYKLDQEDNGSSYVYTPESSKMSPSDLLATAMPTHPAYIPRALVRGTTPRMSPTSRQFSTPSPPSPPSAPTSAGNPSSGGPYQSYQSRESVNYSANQSPPYYQSHHQQYISPPQSASSHLRSPASKLSPLILPTSAKSKYSSPRVIPDETTTVITAPAISHRMAISPPIPRSYQPQQVYDEYAGSGTEQQQQPQRSAGLSFRERSNSISAGASLDRSTSQQQRAGKGRKEQYEEVEIGQDSEIW